MAAPALGEKKRKPWLAKWVHRSGAPVTERDSRMEDTSSPRKHKSRGSRTQHSGTMASKIVLIAIGVALGAGQLALGAYLTSGNNGWSTSLLFSVVGLVGASVGTFSWHSRRNRGCLIMAGVAVALGVLGSMGLMLEVSQETSGIVHAWSQVPLALGGWMLIWAVWIAVGLARVLFFEPPHTRHRLSSRRGDAGS